MTPEDIYLPYDYPSDADFDFEDIDCKSCGLKFFIRPPDYKDGKKEWPTECDRCKKELPPLYEY